MYLCTYLCTHMHVCMCVYICICMAWHGMCACQRTTCNRKLSFYHLCLGDGAKAGLSVRLRVPLIADPFGWFHYYFFLIVHVSCEDTPSDTWWDQKHLKMRKSFALVKVHRPFEKPCRSLTHGPKSLQTLGWAQEKIDQSGRLTLIVK